MCDKKSRLYGRGTENSILGSHRDGMTIEGHAVFCYALAKGSPRKGFLLEISIKRVV